MKKIIIIWIGMLFFTVGYSQTDVRMGRHIFNIPLELTQCNYDGTAVTGVAMKQIMERDWIFTIENIVGTDYVIRVAEFTAKTTEATDLNKKTFLTANAEPIYYKMTMLQYRSVAEAYRKKGSFVVGASTTLIKIRPGNNKDGDEAIYSEFGNDFNVGLTAGWRIIPSRNFDFAVSIVGGFSFSSIKVTPQTTRNFITSEATQSCITFNGGLVFEIEKFQISTFVGIDAMSGEVGKNWIYRNRPWIGLGFGYEIFKPSGKTENP